MAQENLSSIANPIEKKNAESQPPTPFPVEKATSACGKHTNGQRQKTGTEPYAVRHKQ